MVWEDTLHNLDYDGPPENATGLIELKEIGFLVRKTAKMVTLANEIDPKEGTVRGVVSIPAKTVKEIIYLEQKNEPKHPNGTG